MTESLKPIQISLFLSDTKQKQGRIIWVFFLLLSSFSGWNNLFLVSLPLPHGLLIPSQFLLYIPSQSLSAQPMTMKCLFRDSTSDKHWFCNRKYGIFLILFSPCLFDNMQYLEKGKKNPNLWLNMAIWRTSELNQVFTFQSSNTFKWVKWYVV